MPNYEVLTEEVEVETPVSVESDERTQIVGLVNESNLPVELKQKFRDVLTIMYRGVDHDNSSHQMMSILAELNETKRAYYTDLEAPDSEQATANLVINAISHQLMENIVPSTKKAE